MKSRLSMMVGAAVLVTLGAFSTAGAGEAPAQSDKEVAAQYKSEAAQLRKKAADHRMMASGFRMRGAGKVDYSSVAAHCDTIARNYEEAAKAADSVSSELSK